MYTLKIDFEQNTLNSTEIAVENGLSILEGVLQNNLHLNHNCGGVCACTTCHIYVHAGAEYIEPLSDREEDFIDRAISPSLESRLACQCILNDTGSGFIHITIPDQSGIIGHEH